MIAHGQDGVNKFSDLLDYSSKPLILDIGAGEEERHANFLRDRGCEVETVDLFDTSTYKANYNYLKLDKQFDGVHAAHVLEHQLNTHDFLRKVYWDLKDGGWLCITVPPLKHQIVGGHVSLWNAGLVLYHLVLAGFNCKDVKILEYGYNISVIVKKVPLSEKLTLSYTGPDLKRINKYLPKGIKYTGVNMSFNGDIKKLNWN